MSNSVRPYTFLLTGGGTGGHIYPAIAIADALRCVQGDARIAFAGSRDRIEWKAVPKAGYDIHPIWISGIQRRLTLSNLLVPVKLIVSLIQSFFIIQKMKPDAVICTGGYVSGPVGWMAAKRSVPVFLQEQNSFPGVTTRMLSGFAARVFTAFEQAERHLPKAKGRISLLGNPTRKEIAQSNATSAHASFGLQPDKRTVLILGGSGGAAAVNDAVLLNLNTLHSEMNLQLIWQCGPRYLESLESKIDASNYGGLHLTKFIDNMAEAYATADIVITRAGAGICTELLIAGKPSVLMPSPNVAGDHQRQNASAMAEGKAAIILEDKDASEKLPEVLKGLMASPEKLQQMKQAALSMAKPDAAAQIAAEITDILDNRRKSN